MRRCRTGHREPGIPALQTGEDVKHWHVLPPLLQRHAPSDALSYVLYLAGGCVVACHLEQVGAWVRRHARLVLALTAVSALAAEGVYFLARCGVTTVPGATSDPFQPSVIPFNIGAIACCYLAGVALVRPGRPRFTRAVVRSGSDNAYGVYLVHMLVITTLVWLGWKNLNAVLPWPLLCLLTVGIVVVCCVPLTALLARTPLAVPLTGRRRAPWRRPRAQQAARHELDGPGPRGALGVPQRQFTEATRPKRRGSRPPRKTAGRDGGRADSVRGTVTPRGGETRERCTHVGAPHRRHGRAVDVGVAGSAASPRHSRKAPAHASCTFHHRDIVERCHRARLHRGRGPRRALVARVRP